MWGRGEEGWGAGAWGRGGLGVKDSSGNGA